MTDHRGESTYVNRTALASRGVKGKVDRGAVHAGQCRFSYKCLDIEVDKKEQNW